METVTDESFGVVPVIKEGDEWRVLLVHQISYRGSNDRFWTFPKGHKENAESPVETARRELLEETGVTDVRIVEDAAFVMAYTFKFEGKRIEKTVTYYLGVCSDVAVQISQPKEIADLGWFTIKSASEKLSHKNAQKILTQAALYINQHSDSL